VSPKYFHSYRFPHQNSLFCSRTFVQPNLPILISLILSPG
jgi:hypothetical protein